MRTGRLRVNGVELVADLSGALLWPAERALVVADLHLEKGSSYAPGGRFLPPYDTAETLASLARLVDSHGVGRLVCVGDSFHDPAALERMPTGLLERLRTLTKRCECIWIDGNHDPGAVPAWAGRSTEQLTLGALTFRHEAERGRGGAGEISGHFHPKAAVRVRGRRISARCFVTDGRRLVLPAFGAYTGGLNVMDPALSGLFPKGLTVHLLGRERIFEFPKASLVA